MFKWILCSSFILLSTMTNAQRISINDILVFLKGKTIAHIEDSLKKKGFILTKTEASSDKSRILYLYAQQKNGIATGRSFDLTNYAAVAPKGRLVSYSTNDATEYALILEEFKKNGFEEITKGNMGSGIDYWNFSNSDYNFQLIRKPLRNKDGSKSFSYTIMMMPF